MASNNQSSKESGEVSSANEVKSISSGSKGGALDQSDMGWTIVADSGNRGKKIKAE